jgi:hypothetical protein
MKLIEKAVLPLKTDAIFRAEQDAKKIVANVETELREANYDLRVAAPYPKGSLGRVEYFVALSRYQLFQKVTRWRKSSVSMHEPQLADMDQERIQEFIQEAKDDAAIAYDAFVVKLTDKIGPVTSARLEGNHVWGWSHLFVATTRGPEIWKTQIIGNVSKLGKYFHQHPTRKVKKVQS